METNSFTCLKLHTPRSNLKLKQMVSYLILLPLCEEFARVIHSHTVMAEVLAIFIDADTRIKGVQIGDHEIKQ